MLKKRVGVLISGRGSNMRALVEACKAADYPADIACVASNIPEAGGLDYARAEGIATIVVPHKQFASREVFDAALNAELQKAQSRPHLFAPDFMRIMTPVLINPWAGRMLNIHPSLLPLYKGLHTP